MNLNEMTKTEIRGRNNSVTEHVETCVETVLAEPKLAQTPSGTGLFAQCAIEKGDRLYAISGVLRPKPTRMTLQISSSLHIDPGDATWRLINHSCDPNVGIDFTDWSFRALRHIAAGEELRFNYLTTEEQMAAPFECCCGDSNCIGTIAGFKSLSPQQQQRLASLAAAHLQGGQES